LKNLLRFGVVVAGLLFCLGCDSGPPPVEAEAEAKQLNESPDYEAEMMGGGDAAGDAAGGGDAANE
jgi:hypothetical protein